MGEGGPPAAPRGKGLEGDNEELATEVLETFLETRGDEDFGVFLESWGAENSERKVAPNLRD